MERWNSGALGFGQPTTPTLRHSSIFSVTESVNLDLHELTPDQQVGRLKEQYVLLRGQGAVVRARTRELPVRQYISLLERGYRVALERDGESFVLVLRPDGSTPRLGLRGAHSVVSHPDGRVYTNTTDNRVAVIDALSRRVKRHIPTGDEPSHLELSHDCKRLYVGKAVYLHSGPDRDVTVLGGDGEFRAKLPVGAAPHDIAVLPDSRWAYQPNSASHTVTVIDGKNYSASGEIKVGLGPGHIAFDPESRFAYVANTVSDDLTVVRTNDHEVVASIPAGRGAHLPAVSPDGRFGYVANFASDDLTVWDCSNHQPSRDRKDPRRHLSALLCAPVRMESGSWFQTRENRVFA
jgi:YVTN family beta-propeller protein